MIGAASSLVAMALLVRFLTPEYHVLQLIFLRSVVNLCLMAPWIARSGLATAKTRRLALHGLRNGLLYAGNVAWFFGVTLVTLAELSALQFTMPIFVVAMAVVVLGERVDLPRACVVAAGFLGTLVILRPTEIALGIGPVVVLAAAFFYASAFIATKKLSSSESGNVVVFYMSLFVLAYSAIPAAFVWRTPEAADLPAIAALGVAGYSTHYCVTRAMAAADASFVVPFDFLRLPLSVAAGVVLFGEGVDLPILLGAAIIFCAAYYNTWREERRGGPLIR